MIGRGGFRVHADFSGREGDLSGRLGWDLQVRIDVDKFRWEMGGVGLHAAGVAGFGF